MLNPSGSVTINGITDTELAEIIEIKAKHHAQNQNFTFNPQQLSVGNINTPQGVQSFYNNATFSWNGETGLTIMQEIITFLLNKDVKAQAQGQ